MSKSLLALTLLTCACSVRTISAPPDLSSFKVTAQGVYVYGAAPDGGTGRALLGYSSTCAANFDGGVVPDDARGTSNCRYVIPRGQVEIEITAIALDRNGNALTNFTGTASFKVLPGQLGTDIAARWGRFENGELHATVKSIHQYGEVRVWVQDAPPEPVYANGEVVSPELYPVEAGDDAGRTFASGLSQTIWFENQTLQSLQVPDGTTNISSPFVGEFVAVGKNPESGERLLQSCSNDPRRDGQQSVMVITGIDPSGFFITDITACRLLEAGSTRTPEPNEPCQVTLGDGAVVPIEQGGGVSSGSCAISGKACTATTQCLRYMPGTYGSMFVYNFNYPDGLNQGDLLFTVSGSIQEFTSTTQMVFPAWTIAESVRLLPPDQWDKWLRFAPITDINGRLCGLDNVGGTPFITDALCGMSSSNLKLESLESALVRVRGITLPKRFVNCDLNGDGTLPCFSNHSDRIQGGTVYSWGNCNFTDITAIEAPNDIAERECVQNCVLGRGPDADMGQCTEGATYTNFGQYAVEMAPAGPAFANLDTSLPSRVVSVTLNAAGEGRAQDLGFAPSRGFEARAQLGIACDVPVFYRLGDNNVVATTTDTRLEARQSLQLRLPEGSSAIAFKSDSSVSGTGTCSVSYNPRMRINIVTKDSIPELTVNCSVTDSNADRATQCRNTLGASYDVVGHLRQVQAARPRWVITPRDTGDMCCYPGPGLECPAAVKPCVTSTP